MEILLDGNTIGLRKWTETNYDWRSMFNLARLYLGNNPFTLYDVTGRIVESNEENPSENAPTGASIIYCHGYLVGFLSAEKDSPVVDTATEILKIFLEASNEKN